jgi:hypothetical protein
MYDVAYVCLMWGYVLTIYIRLGTLTVWYAYVYV